MNLAAVIITKNEEASIARCLESVRFCDEIIVVDAQSTDATAEIARRVASQVHVKPWTNFSAQKNLANSLTSCDWILSIDADEEVSPELKEEIVQLFKATPDFAAYSIPRRTLYGGRWVRYGGWYPNRLTRLFRRDSGSWQGEELHERWETAGSVGKLQSDLIHHSFKNIADQVERNNLYSSLGAANLHRRGAQFSCMRLLIKPWFKFLETYFLKRGFLDGYPGLIIAISAAYSVFLKWAKLWEIQKRETRPEFKPAKVVSLPFGV